jgi:hypothetical protein
MNFSNNLYLTSNDFSSFCNVSYSDRILYLENEKFDESYEIIEVNTNPDFKCLIYKKRNFIIKNGDSIFCHTDQLNNLFFHLKKIEKLKNLTLVTHQTDKLILRKDFERKPKSIERWFSVNVGFKNESLIPIPIGIASNFSKKNLTLSNFELENFNVSNYLKKEINLYINFEVNTNYKERSKIYDQFANKSWVNIDSPNQNKASYLNNLKSHSFVLCPWGNGVDTHRFWETLYAGSIPVTKYHPTYEAASELPVLFVKEYSEINENLLLEFMNSFKLENYNFDKLTKNYWKNIITLPSSSDYSEKIVETNLQTFFYKQIRKSLKIKNKIIKKIKTFIQKINKNFLRF